MGQENIEIKEEKGGGAVGEVGAAEIRITQLGEPSQRGRGNRLRRERSLRIKKTCGKRQIGVFRK